MMNGAIIFAMFPPLPPRLPPLGTWLDGAGATCFADVAGALTCCALIFAENQTLLCVFPVVLKIFSY